jgi:hypothetical protein
MNIFQHNTNTTPDTPKYRKRMHGILCIVGNKDISVLM